jgi:hypothetical protein
MPNVVKDEKYWELVRAKAKELKSDGCTSVADFRIDCCYEHDIPYATGLDVFGKPQGKAQTDKEFRQCIQERSPLGRLSPMSWIRWAGVRLFGRGIWAKKQ